MLFRSPARVTEFDPFELTKAKQDLEMEALTFKPEEWGMKRGTENEDFMFLNLGPNHPSAHGAFRIILQLDGEEIIDCVPDIGYHHRGAEKMGERQSWHSYIPYTDRIEYLGGCVNEMPYVLAVEKLAGITVPDRVNVIRVMLSELFRINSHLLYISTFIQDVGAMTPVFFAFTDRQKIYDLVEAITGFRMHPAWFRIGGVAHDLPRGWDRLLREFLEWMPKRLDSYEKAALRNTILIGRSKGVAAYNAKEALEWGTTGAGLRATGIGFDVRKWRPYSGYENFDFGIPTGGLGDGAVLASHVEDLGPEPFAGVDTADIAGVIFFAGLVAQAGNFLRLLHRGMVFPQHEHGVGVVGELIAQRQHVAVSVDGRGR